MSRYSARFPSSRHSLGKPIAKTPKTAVVIIPPQRVWQFIQNIRKKHDRQFNRWMPHITMLFPFKPKSEFDWALEELQHVCASFKSFEISLKRFDKFRQGKKNHTIWLAPEPREKIIELQERIFQIFPECEDVQKFAQGFNPHLSVGQTASGAKMRTILEDLEKSWKPIKFQVSEVSLIWRKDPPNDKFQVWDTAPLSK
jgi:RNA 2',3'-cyclic 3'-phosphodiesterase